VAQVVECQYCQKKKRKKQQKKIYKTTMRYYFTSVRMGITKKTKNASNGYEERQRQRNPSTFLVGM
jgi:thioredoxin-related protein